MGLTSLSSSDESGESKVVSNHCTCESTLLFVRFNPVICVCDCVSASLYPQVPANKQATATFLIPGWLIIHELLHISCEITFGLIMFAKLDGGNRRLE